MTESGMPRREALTSGLPAVPAPRHANPNANPNANGEAPAAALLERIRNNAEVAAPRGITRIADDVVAKVAAIAVREVPGVHSLGGDVTRMFAAVRERVGISGDGGGGGGGVSVQLRDRRAEVNVTVIVGYGHVVLEVAEAVRANVIAAVERMLGLQVTEVNVAVDDVHVPNRQGS